MNPKENPSVGDLAQDVHTAIEQERKINQDVENALGNLTSNVGQIIQEIINDTV